MLIDISRSFLTSVRSQIFRRLRLSKNCTLVLYLLRLLECLCIRGIHGDGCEYISITYVRFFIIL